jgi:hypothetical protein
MSALHPHSAAAVGAHAHQTDPRDTLGQVLSAVCAVHCAATPLVLMLAPAAGSLLGGVHPLLFVFVFAVALWAFIPGYRCHHRAQVLVLAAAGITLLGTAAFLFHDSIALDTGFSVAGASVMMLAHWRNRVLLRTAHTHAH